MMAAPVQDFAVDEFGRIYVCSEDGNPYMGPFETMEEAEAWLDSFEVDGNDAG